MTDTDKNITFPCTVYARKTLVIFVIGDSRVALLIGFLLARTSEEPFMACQGNSKHTKRVTKEGFVDKLKFEREIKEK